MKRDFETVDTRAILTRVAALPMASWRFKTEPARVRHVGPMAQDFRAAFGLGIDDVTIATVDEEGIALAAIQGLNAKMDDVVQAKERELTELRHALAALKDELRTLARVTHAP